MVTNPHATPTQFSPKCPILYPKIFQSLQLKQGEGGADAEAEGEAVEAAAGVYVEGLAVLHNVQTCIVFI